MIAREGYLVMEIGYNLPQYGQKNLFLRSELDLEYFVQAAKKLLKHDKCYGDRVVVMGQSKGGDLALALGKGNYSIKLDFHEIPVVSNKMILN